MPTMTDDAQQALKGLGDVLKTMGEAFVRAGAALASATEGVEVVSNSLAEHYSQKAKDARQYPVLALFAPLNPDSDESLPWSGPGGVKVIAMQNGYTSSGLGGFFSEGGLLTWDPERPGHVKITEAGRKRFKEIEERVQMDDLLK